MQVMPTRKITIIVIWTVITVVLLYDLTLLLTGGADTTISDVLRGTAHDWPVVPFLTGMVCGHLFFGMGKREDKVSSEGPTAFTAMPQRSVLDVLNSVITDGPFNIPVQRRIEFSSQKLLTGGLLVGRISAGVVVFNDPKPKAAVVGCLAEIQSIQPEPPDSATVLAVVPVIGLQRKRIKIEDV